MAIRVLSFDFDGCLFNSEYISSKEKDVVRSNQAFLEQIRQENLGFTKVFTFVGSNRQSFGTDQINAFMGGKGSCYPAVQKVSVHLGTTLDTFLLADIYGDLPDGTSFARATDKNYQGAHSDWLFDETKVTILYAQMHKIAMENPNEEIVLDFYDDRGNGARRRHTDILEQLRDFYSNHPALIPANVTLRLHQYDGGGVTPMAVIKGTGFIDKNYKQTVKDLAQQAVTPYNDGIGNQIHVAEHAKPELLLNREAFSVSSSFVEIQSTTVDLDEDGVHMIVEESQIFAASMNQDPNFLVLDETEEEHNDLNLDSLSFDIAKPLLTDDKKVKAAKQKFANAMQGIMDKADELDGKAFELHVKTLPAEEQSADYKSYKEAAKAARALHTALKSASERFNEDQDGDAFKQAAATATQTAIDSELKEHRGYLKQILGYSGLAVLAVLTIATAGLAYALAGAINYRVNRQFFFSTTINTDSVNKVLDLQEAVETLAAPAA